MNDGAISAVALTSILHAADVKDFARTGQSLQIANHIAHLNGDFHRIIYSAELYRPVLLNYYFPLKCGSGPALTENEWKHRIMVPILIKT
jgi:hypothetical protein